MRRKWKRLGALSALTCVGIAAHGTATTASRTQAPPTYETWDEVLDAARGSTVNWFMWGGDDIINTNVDNDIGDAVAEQFGVTLNRVPVSDTADAVNQVLDESAAVTRQFIVGIENSAPSLTPDGQREVIVLVLV